MLRSALLQFIARAVRELADVKAAWLSSESVATSLDGGADVNCR